MSEAKPYTDNSPDNASIEATIALCRDVVFDGEPDGSGDYGQACSNRKVIELCESVLALRATLARVEQERDEDDRLRTRMADLLTRTANALKGQPEPLHLHDWSELPIIAASVAMERDEAMQNAREEGELAELALAASQAECARLRDRLQQLCEAAVSEDDERITACIMAASSVLAERILGPAQEGA